MMQLVQQHQVSPVKNTVECLMHSGHLTARRFSLGTPLTVQNVCKMWWFCIHGPYCYTYWYQKTLFFFYIPLLVKRQCQYMSLCEHFDKSSEPSVNKHEMRIYEEWRHVLFYFFLRRTEKKEREPVMLAATLILLFFFRLSLCDSILSLPIRPYTQPSAHREIMGCQPSARKDEGEGGKGMGVHQEKKIRQAVAQRRSHLSSITVTSISYLCLFLMETE